MAKRKANDLLSNELVQQAIDAAGKVVASEAYEEFSHHMQMHFERGVDEADDESLAFDSPLEAVFWVWWMALRKNDTFSSSDIKLGRHIDVVVAGQKYVIDFTVECVLKMGAAREYILAHWPKIAIELDGHAFHEKTLEQVTYRNQRDRALQQAGWRVFHFSFSEFMADPFSYVLEPIEFARAQYARLWTEYDATRTDKA